MTGKMKREDFEPHLNTNFRLLHGGPEPLELELIEITGGGRALANSYSFSLIFRGGLHFRLEQHIFTLEHDELGTLDIFLVPIKHDAEGFYYEAVFNRPLK